MRFAVRFPSLLAVLAATVALAACGDDSETSSQAPSSDGSSASSGTSNAQDAAQVKLLQCLREQGIDVPDAGGTDDAFAQMSPAERQRAEDALRGPCQRYAPQAFGSSDHQSEEFLDALTTFTACLRKNGADVPDPDPENPFSVLHSLDQSDPTIAAAISACRSKLPSLNGGG
jgi:hypothetical protein